VRFLSGVEDEGVVIQQRQGIGDQLVQLRIAELQRWLGIARRELLPQEVGNVIGSIGAGGGCPLERSGHRLGTVLPDQLEQFRDLA
jgi:hypothetical protein